MARVMLGRRPLLAAPALLAGARARAQGTFPERPITLLVPFPAGGATDVQMRALAEAATRHFGQQVIIENKPGAGSTLGVSTVARGRPDGYTVAQMTLPAVRLPLLQPMTYDPLRDVTPIIHLTGYTFCMVTRADGPYKSWADLVADAKRRPGQIRIGNTGANGTPHLTVVEMAERAGIEVVHVPFRGEAEAVPQVLGGHIEATTGGTGVGPMVNEGRLRFLNFWTRERVKQWPDVPTLLDLGYEGMVVTSPYGLVGPPGLPGPILAALHEGFRKALFDPQHRATLERLDQPVEYLNSADYARNLVETYEMERRRVERLGLRQR